MMGNTELLKNARNLLLKLHKDLVDFERESYEMFNGKVSSGQFLNLRFAGAHIFEGAPNSTNTPVGRILL